MTETDFIFPIRYMKHLINRLQTLKRLFIFKEQAVMISDNKMLMPFKLLQIPICRILRVIADISENIYLIIIRHLLIPAPYHVGIHLIPILIWSFVKCDNIRMSKVKIAYI